MKKTSTTPSSSISRAPRKTAAKSSRKTSGGTPGPTGKLTKEETTPLVLQAKEAYFYQQRLGRIEPGTSENEWRREMVFDEVGLYGISKINRSHWRTVMGHFCKLAGKEDKAYELEMKTGTKSYRPKNDDDTWESSETYAALINQALDEHCQIAEKSEEELIALGFEDAAERKAALAAFGKGPIQAGWLLTAARQRSKKPSLTMAKLAERLDPETLCGLLSHLKSHINKREGRADEEKRKPRRYPKKADPGEMSDPF